MRRVVLLLFMTCSLVSFGQVSHPFIDTNSTWRIEDFYYSGIDDPEWYYYDRSFDPLTFVEDDSLRTAEFQGRPYWEEKASGRVWYIGEYNDDSLLLYDFSMEIGDTLVFKEGGLLGYRFPCNLWDSMPDSTLLIATNVETVPTAGNRKIIEIERHESQDTAVFPSGFQHCETFYWIEGIGKILFPFRNATFYLDFYTKIDCYRYDGSPLEIPNHMDAICTPLGYGDLASPHLEIYPNPSSGILHVEGDFNGPIEIIDHFGGLVSRFDAGRSQIDISNLPSGIYLLRIGDRVEKIALNRPLRP